MAIDPPCVSRLFNSSAASQAAGRSRMVPNRPEALAICEVWSEKRADVRDRPFSFGERIRASGELLTKLCKLSGKKLVLEVRIKRRIDRDQARETFGLILPSRKVFVLSSDRVLSDKKSRHQIS